MKRGMCIFLIEPYFSSFGYIARSRIAELSGNSLFNFLRWLHTVFQRSCTILHTHQVYESQFLHILTNMRFVLFWFKNGHSNRCEVISNCGLDFYFSDDWWFWVTYLIPISHLYFFFEGVCIQVLCPFFRIIWILLSSCWSSLHNLDVNHFANSSSQPVGRFLALLLVLSVCRSLLVYGARLPPTAFTASAFGGALIANYLVMLIRIQIIKRYKQSMPDMEKVSIMCSPAIIIENSILPLVSNFIFEYQQLGF